MGPGRCHFQQDVLARVGAAGGPGVEAGRLPWGAACPQAGEAQRLARRTPETGAATVGRRDGYRKGVQTSDAGAISATYERIRPHVRRTPVVEPSGTDFGLAAFPLAVKLEALQHAGSFKTRGAFANLLLRVVPSAGVVAASGGNHGAAVAYAAHRLGVPARIFVPTVSSPSKIARVCSYGAELVVVGDRYADASEVWLAESGALPVHAYEQIETLLGQGSVGLELSDQVPSLETLLVAVGGGGLIGGVAAWYAGGIRVVGVEPEGAPTRVGALMFPIAQRFVERVLLVDDDAIRAAQHALWDVLRVVAEPGAAAPLAALLSGRYVPAHNERVGVLISGANTVAVDFSRG